LVGFQLRTLGDPPQGVVWFIYAPIRIGQQASAFYEKWLRPAKITRTAAIIENDYQQQ
jgi:hypothetical protein